jgi:hypothetical protein
MTGGSIMQGDPMDMRAVVVIGTIMSIIMDDAMLGITTVIPLNHWIQLMIIHKDPLDLYTIIDPRLKMIYSHLDTGHAQFKGNMRPERGQAVLRILRRTTWMAIAPKKNIKRQKSSNVTAD